MGKQTQGEKEKHLWPGASGKEATWVEETRPKSPGPEFLYLTPECRVAPNRAGSEGTLERELLLSPDVFKKAEPHRRAGAQRLVTKGM